MALEHENNSKAEKNVSLVSLKIVEKDIKYTEKI